jgi:pyrimidine oxygenase
MTRTVELGVFMPVASNGFLMSCYTPRYQPTFEMHREIAVTAEEIGLDYLFWMGKWKGFGGESGFWEGSLEPLSLLSGIATATSRVKLFATISPLLFHPVVASKMLATIDDVSQGRAGINIVTGNTLDEYEQMGIVPEGYSARRYEYADEWVTVLKRLWTEERVTHHGQFFHLEDCVSRPKPVRRPYPYIVSAGISDEGLGFAAKHSDYSFQGPRREQMAKVRSLAAGYGRGIRICTNLFLLQRDTDAEAEEELRLIRENIDQEAVDNLIASFNRDQRPSYEMRMQFLKDPSNVGFGSGKPVTGSPETIARKLASLILDDGMDGLQFTFIDFVEGLYAFGDKTLPILRQLLARADVVTGSQALAAA